MPARRPRPIYQDRAAGPGLGKMDALLASREVHEDLLLDRIAREQLTSAGRPPRPSLVGRVRTWLHRR